MEIDRYLNYFAIVILCFAVFYIGGHLIVATANGWDGINTDTNTDIEITIGTKETVENSGLVIPGGDIQITDSKGEATDLEVIQIHPDTGGPTQIEVYDSETNEYYELEMSIK